MAASSRHLTELLGGSVSVNAGLASATGTANSAVVLTEPHDAYPSAASATGTGNNAKTSVKASAGIASATGTSYSVPFINIELNDLDGGSGHESEFIEVQISDSDSGAATDTDGRPGDALSSSDTGMGTENQTVFVSTPAPGDPGGARTPRWVFVDGAEELAFEINPSATTEIPRSKRIVYQNSLGPSARSVIFETEEDALTFSWSGTTLTEDQYNTFITWFSKPNEIQLLDDLGRVYTIFVTDFQPKRVRSAQHPWLHTYDMKALVLSEG